MFLNFKNFLVCKLLKRFYAEILAAIEMCDAGNEKFLTYCSKSLGFHG